MAFTPNSRVYLLDTPLDNNYKNQLRFTSIDEQFNYFYTRKNHDFEGVTYQRKDNIIRVDAHIDTLWDSNYVMYKNENFINKWFYAFITKMEFVNNHATDIFIETDVYQTWLFECTLKPSFVIREHVSNDAIGANLIDEQLEYGEYKTQEYNAINKMGTNWNILAVSDNSPMGEYLDWKMTGNIYGNVCTGLTYYPFGNNAQGREWLKTTIEAYTAIPDAIVMIFSVPRMVIKNTLDNADWLMGRPIMPGDSYGTEDVTINKKLDNLDGYVPKNNKLFIYPYKFLYMSNNNGQSATYRYEDFSDVGSMEFFQFGAVMPDPVIMLCPCNYKGIDLSYEYGLALKGFPLGSWQSDTFAAWFAQNSGALGIGYVESTVGILGGLATGNALGVIGGALKIGSQMAEISKASLQPDQARGHVGSGSVMFSTNALDFYYSHMTIKAEFAKKIDNYFSMYGYKVNALKIPETHSRQNWNYIQTIDINIEGAIPVDDMIKLKSIYDDGITLWHTTGNFLNYAIDNDIV